MPTYAGQMTQTPPGNPQWRACDGSTLRTRQPPVPPQTARPKAGVSEGTYRDYWRNVGSASGSKGIGGYRIRLPYDPSHTWFISTADDTSETTLVGAPTPRNPPPGIR